MLPSGNSEARVGQEALRLHPSFNSVEEVHQEMVPELAGKRLFLVRYNGVENADVEVIRQGLVQKLGYETSSSCVFPFAQTWMMFC